MATRPDPKKNQLPAALPAQEWARWLPAPEPADMPLGQIATVGNEVARKAYDRLPPVRTAQQARR